MQQLLDDYFDEIAVHRFDDDGGCPLQPSDAEKPSSTENHQTSDQTPANHK